MCYWTNILKLDTEEHKNQWYIFQELIENPSKKCEREKKDKIKKKRIFVVKESFFI